MNDRQHQEIREHVNFPVGEQDCRARLVPFKGWSGDMRSPRTWQKSRCGGVGDRQPAPARGSGRGQPVRAGPRGDGTARGEAAGAGGRQHSGGRRGDEAYCARRDSPRRRGHRDFSRVPRGRSPRTGGPETPPLVRSRRGDSDFTLSTIA